MQHGAARPESRVDYMQLDKEKKVEQSQDTELVTEPAEPAFWDETRSEQSRNGAARPESRVDYMQHDETSILVKIMKNCMIGEMLEESKLKEEDIKHECDFRAMAKKMKTSGKEGVERLQEGPKRAWQGSGPEDDDRKYAKKTS